MGKISAPLDKLGERLAVALSCAGYAYSTMSGKHCARHALVSDPNSEHARDMFANRAQPALLAVPTDGRCGEGMTAGPTHAEAQGPGTSRDLDLAPARSRAGMSPPELSEVPRAWTCAWTCAWTTAGAHVARAPRRGGDRGGVSADERRRARVGTRGRK